MQPVKLMRPFGLYAGFRKQETSFIRVDIAQDNSGGEYFK